MDGVKNMANLLKMYLKARVHFTSHYDVPYSADVVTVSKPCFTFLLNQGTFCGTTDYPYFGLRVITTYPPRNHVYKLTLCFMGLRLLSWIGHVNTIAHCVTLFSHHSHLCHCSWLYPYVIVTLHGHRVKAPQCSGGDYGFLNYHSYYSQVLCSKFT